ncbi:hypothetical protein, partial [Bilophila wadsworthia]
CPDTGFLGWPESVFFLFRNVKERFHFFKVGTLFCCVRDRYSVTGQCVFLGVKLVRSVAGGVSL